MENEAKFWEAKMIIIGILQPNPKILEILWLSVTVSEILHWNFSAWKGSLFCIFWAWPRFLRSSVTRVKWPDAVWWFWWKVDFNQLNILSNVWASLCFSRWPIFQLENSCSATLIYAAYFLYTTRTLIIFHKRFLN